MKEKVILIEDFVKVEVLVHSDEVIDGDFQDFEFLAVVVVNDVAQDVRSYNSNSKLKMFKFEC